MRTSATSTVSQKGQVTIPKRVRVRLGLVPGTVLEFRAQDGELVAQKRSLAKVDPVSAVTGILKRRFEHTSVDVYLEEVRGGSAPAWAHDTSRRKRR